MRTLEHKIICAVTISLLSFILACKSESPDSKTNQVQKSNNSIENSSTKQGQPKSKFDFESGTQGWIYQTWDDSQGVIRVEQTSAKAKTGNYSLHLDCNLIGGSRTNSKGEAFIDLRPNPPDGVSIPANLTNKEITCWVYIPSNSAIGDPHRPNGIQFFSKSVANLGTPNEKWSAQYGSWNNLLGRTGSWFEITYKPGLENPIYGYTEPGFDPSKIVVMGVKIATGTGSTATFKGSVFIDDIAW